MKQAARFLMIDGLRGVAALAVVCYHLRLAVDEAARGPWLWDGLRWVINRGFLGVDVFFVLSGFVIAYSTRTGPHNLSFLGRFALRRSIRLDPPYWVAIALEVLLVTLTIRLFPSLGTELPTLKQVIAHLFYAQNILGYGDIVTIFWTLCYEVQFYLFFVLLRISWQQLPNRVLAVIVLTALFVASLSVRFTTVSLSGFALDRWFQFFLGVMAWWVLAGKVQARVLVATWFAVMIVALAAGKPDQIVGVGTSILMVVAGVRGKMGSWLAGRTIQFLGKISYSLYLIHLAVGWRAISLVGQLSPPLSAPQAIALFLGGIALSVASAAVMWRLIEYPSIALSKRIAIAKRPPSNLVTPVSAAVPAGGT